MKKILLLALCVLSCAAFAQAQRVDGCACGIPASVPDPFTIRHVDPGFQQSAMDAFNTWNLYVDVYRPVIDTSAPASLNNGVNEIVFTDLSQVPGLDSTVIGYTQMVPDTAFGDFNECPVPAGTNCSGSLRETDVLMNNQVPWNTTRPAVGDTSLYYQATATHELGHALGFHHNWQNYSEMNYLPHFTRFLSRTDVLAARAQFPSRVRTVTDLATYPFTYDPTQQTGSGDGANAITVANVSPAAVAPGGTITLNNWTAENLSNNAISTVRLRIYLSTNSTITTSDILLGSFHFGSADALTTWSQDTSGTQFTIPAGTPAGQYYVGALIGTGDSNFQTDSIGYNNSWVLPTPITVGSGSGGTPTTCSPSSTNVCLVGNRFQVTVKFNGQTMQANQFTANTGLFYQNDPTNIEVLLKMIDACSFNAKFWVYAGGTTDQNIFITVVDTKTRVTKTYNPPANKPFQTITDSSAFSCP